MAFKLWRCFKIVIWRNFQHWLMTMVERLPETFGHWGVFNKFSFHFVAKIWEFQDWRWWGKECVVAVIVVRSLNDGTCLFPIYGTLLKWLWIELSVGVVWSLKINGLVCDDWNQTTRKEVHLNVLVNNALLSFVVIKDF
jgi:hypothetical protein